MATKTLTALPALPKMSRIRPKTNACSCGCGQLCGATFVPGHDSRLRAWMLRLERKLVTPDQIPDGERQAAVAALKNAGGHVTPHTRPAQVAVPAKAHDRKAARKARKETPAPEAQPVETPATDDQLDA